MIDNRFACFENKDDFERVKSTISKYCIVFIKNPPIIWTHDVYYNCVEQSGNDPDICWKYNGNEQSSVSTSILNDNFELVLHNPNNLSSIEITIDGPENIIYDDNGVIRLISDKSSRISGRVIVTATFNGNDEYKSSTTSCEIVVNKEQYLSFGWSKSTDTVVIGQEAQHVFPVLANDKHFQNIIYSSSNTSVATIDSETGQNIEIKNVGTTQIKAHFEGNNLYNEQDASYTLTVQAQTIPAYIGSGTNAQSIISDSNKILDRVGTKTYNIQVQSGDSIWIIMPTGITYSAVMGGQPMGLETHSEGIFIDNVQYDVKSTVQFNTTSTKTFTLTYN